MQDDGHSGSVCTRVLLFVVPVETSGSNKKYLKLEFLQMEAERKQQETGNNYAAQ